MVKIMENKPYEQMDDLGVPHGTTIFGNIHLSLQSLLLVSFPLAERLTVSLPGRRVVVKNITTLLAVRAVEATRAKREGNRDVSLPLPDLSCAEEGNSHGEIPCEILYITGVMWLVPCCLGCVHP